MNLLRKQKNTKENNEHVTYSLKKQINLNNIKEKFVNKNYSHMNFSIDYVKEYFNTKKIMEKFDTFETWNKILKNEK